VNLDPELLEILVCPGCRSPLAVDDERSELVCTGCSLAFPVRDDIPVLLLDEARKPPSPPSASADDPPPATADPAERPGDAGA
jgi:hypothetical protein